MSIHALPAVPALDTITNFALISFLARYRGDTLRAYQQDLKAYVRWCAERDLLPLQVTRPHLELYVRWMEDRGYAPATIGRRFTTVAGFYRYAVLDGHLQVDPSVAVTRPKVPCGRRSAAPSCTRWSSPRCSPPPATTARAATPWSHCSA